MRAFRGLLAFVLLGAILGEEQNQSTDDSSEDSGCANFAGELYYGVRKSFKTGEDFVISPVGVSSVLGTLLFAVGQTSAREISNFLYPTCENSSKLDLFEPLNLNRQASQLPMATFALVQKRVSVDKRFEDQAKELGSYVFKTSFLSFQDDFNYFIINKTHDRSMTGFPPLVSLWNPESTRLLFYNHLRYRAQFDQKFSLVDRKLIARQALVLHAHVPELKARVLGLPLHNTSSILLILVPEQGIDLHSVERRLRKVDVRMLPDKLKDTRMDITLQRITEIKYIFLRDVLEDAGIKTVFNETTADLSAFHREVPLDNALVYTEIFFDKDGINTETSDFNKQPIKPMEASGESVKFNALGPIIYAVVDADRVYLMGRSFGEKF